MTPDRQIKTRPAIALLCGVCLLAAGCVSPGGWAAEDIPLRDSLTDLLNRLQARDATLKDRAADTLPVREAVATRPPEYDSAAGEYFWRGKNWQLELMFAQERASGTRQATGFLSDIRALCLQLNDRRGPGSLIYYLYPDCKRVEKIGQTVIDTLRQSSSRLRTQSDLRNAVARVVSSEPAFWHSPMEMQTLLRLISSQPGVEKGKSESQLQRRARELWLGPPTKDQYPSAFAWRTPRFAVRVRCSYYTTISKTSGRILREPGGYVLDEILLTVTPENSDPERPLRTLRLLPGKRILTEDGPTPLSEAGATPGGLRPPGD